MRFSLLAALLLGAGCVHQRTAQFNEAEYAPYGKSGNCSIIGQAFLKTRGGDVKYGAGNVVILNPVTSYSQEWFDVCVVAGKKMTEGDPRVRPYVRETRADGQGGFEFRDVPPGEYFIACPITWEVPAGYGTTETTGGFAYAQAKIQDGQQMRVVLTR